MVIIIGLVFLGAFAVVVLLAMASGTRSAQRSKQAIAALDSALADVSPETHDVMLNIRKGETFSTIPWLNRKLLNVDFALQVRNLLQQADLKWTAGALLMGCGVCFAASAFLLSFRFNSTLLSMLAALPIGFAPFAWVLLKRRKRFRKFEQGLPEAMDLMVSALRAGHSLVAAMGFVANECPDPVGCEFRACCEEQKYGLELKIAMDNLLERVPLQDLRIISTAIMIQSESGGNLAEVLDKTSFVIRERFRLLRQVSVHTAQGRLTGWILTLLPVVLGFALYTVNPEMMSLLWTTPIGVRLLCVAGIMVFVGGLIIRKIVNMDV
jgi:tight adherence protein B